MLYARGRTTGGIGGVRSCTLSGASSTCRAQFGEKAVLRRLELFGLASTLVGHFSEEVLTRYFERNGMARDRVCESGKAIIFFRSFILDERKQSLSAEEANNSCKDGTTHFLRHQRGILPKKVRAERHVVEDLEQREHRQQEAEEVRRILQGIAAELADG